MVRNPNSGKREPSKMSRKPSEAKSYLSTEGGGAAPAPIKRKRTTTRVKAGAKPQSDMETATGSAITVETRQAASPQSSSVISLDPVTEREEVARLAYLLWEARGGQGGSAEEDWLRAEQEFLKKRATAAY